MRKNVEGERDQVDEPQYHVLLGANKVGPYDRRTIVGMRIKKALASADLLIDSAGRQLSVADLIKRAPRERGFEPNRSGSYSVVKAAFAGNLLRVLGPGLSIPRFEGEVEARVQSGVLRIAGRFRRGLSWKQDRVKLPLRDIVHARVQASEVDLWIRHEGTVALQRVTLDMFTSDAAGELVEWLPNATAWPEGVSAPAPLAGSAGSKRLKPALLIALAVLLAAAVLAAVLLR